MEEEAVVGEVAVEEVGVAVDAVDEGFSANMSVERAFVLERGILALGSLSLKLFRKITQPAAMHSIKRQSCTIFLGARGSLKLQTN